MSLEHQYEQRRHKYCFLWSCKSKSPITKHSNKRNEMNGIYYTKNHNNNQRRWKKKQKNEMQFKVKFQFGWWFLVIIFFFLLFFCAFCCVFLFKIPIDENKIGRRVRSSSLAKRERKSNTVGTLVYIKCDCMCISCDETNCQICCIRRKFHELY